MKTILRTIPFFLVLMILTYLVPQIISDSPSEIVTQKKYETELKKETKIGSLPTVKQETFSLAGISLYMGKDSEKVKQAYGEPLRIEPNFFGNERWVYGDNEENYFQLDVSEEGKVTSIFVLGLSPDVSPFKVGMDITEVYQLATLYPTFSIEYKNKDYTIELSDNDLNYHPLVRFENNVFSILMVDRETNKVNAIRYVDKQKLLQSDIYEVTPQNEVSSKQMKAIEFENDDKGNVKEVENTINILRKRYDLTELSYSKELSLLAKDIFTNQNRLISEQSSESDSAQNQLDENESREVSQYQPLTSEVIQKYLEINKITLADNRVIYSDQFANPTWLITYWFSLERQRTILTDPSMKSFGLAFRGEEVMLILNKEESKMK